MLSVFVNYVLFYILSSNRGSSTIFFCVGIGRVLELFRYIMMVYSSAH